MRGEKDVRRLQIAVDQAVGVQRLESRERGYRDRDRFVERDRPVFEPRRQRLALEQLHGDVELSVLGSDVVELADVRVVYPGPRPRFAAQPLGRGRVRFVGANGLQRDRALEPVIPRRIDDAHAALPQRAGDFVWTDCLHRVSSQGTSIRPARTRRTRRSRSRTTMAEAIARVMTRYFLE